jgi:uncharacterized pyridoxamine 5'-phosphate oxidase family protein
VKLNTVQRYLGMAIAALAATASIIMADQAAPGFPPDFVAQLRDRKEIYVATVRKDGTRSTAVPVWFGFMDQAIWFTTGPDSHKGRRVRKGSPIFVSVHGKDGPFVKTRAEIVKDGAIADRLGELYAKKYWIAWLGFFRPSRARNESGKTILLRLTPAE